MLQKYNIKPIKKRELYKKNGSSKSSGELKLIFSN